MKKGLALFVFAGIMVWGWVQFSGSTETSPMVGNFEEPAEVTIAQEHEKTQIEEPGSIQGWMGISVEKLEMVAGEPDWRSQSEFGYEWWGYEEDPRSYTQLGVYNGEVVTGVFMYEGARLEEISINDTYEKVKDHTSFSKEYALESEGSYQFELSEQDLLERPLISLGDQWTGQLYFDRMTERLSAVRFVRNDFLLKMQPYKVVYRGKLPYAIPLDRQEWEVVEEGMEKQILSMTNRIRNRHDVAPLESHEGAAQVAFLHSQDMDANNYFSHYSPEGKGVMERLEGIDYQQAGENIAAQYVDAVDVVHGWLNSEGHRESLLNETFTHVGIGVHQRYYTQNFLTVP
ncbi:hypothetical protein EQV77_05350 [Halobacillus fulvus]|nr:hypothetical protein EQV77_05350 [Halobacillus fulvus]